MIKNAFDRIAACLATMSVGTIGAVVFEGTGTATLTATGAPLAVYDIRVEIMADADGLDDATASLAYSLDGGATWGATVPIPVPGTLALTDADDAAIGVTLTFEDGTFVDGDLYSFPTFREGELPIYLGRTHMLAPGVFPRVVMAPSKGSMIKGGPIRYTDPATSLVTTERTMARRALAFIFWVQHQTYDETELATAKLLKAIYDAGFRFKVGSEDWRDEQIGESQGVTNFVTLEFDGAYLNPATWATLDTILMTTEIVE